MDKDDELLLEKLLNEYTVEINQNMLDDVKKIWVDTIEELVYYREPLEYKRTFQLRDKFKVEIKDDCIYAYIDSDDMEYYSFGRKDNPVTGDFIGHIIDVGHNLGSSPFGETDYFNNYPARHIIQKFANRIKDKYPQFEIEVYRDTPSVM